MTDVAIFDPAIAGTPPYPAGTLVEITVPSPSGYTKRAAQLSDLALSGAIGQTGIQGVPGVAGPQGIPGPVGPQGPLGNPGVIGQTGQIGPTGAPGPQGIPGQTGLQGLTGPVGPQGPAGAAAPATKSEQLTIDWDSNTLVVAGSFIALVASQWTNATILSCSCVCSGGSFTANIQVNGASVTGLRAVNVTSTPATINAATAPALPTAARITVVVSGVTGSPTNAAIQINLQTSFQ